MNIRGRGFDRGRGGGGGRGSPNTRGRGCPPPSYRGGSRGFYDHGGRRGRARGGVFMRGQRADIDRRIADDSDKALVATFSRSNSDMPLRPDFGTQGVEIKLRSNFFPVRVPRGSLYEYHVSIAPVSGTAAHRRLVKRHIYQLAEQTTTWKQAGMTGRVVHDDNAKLISASLLPQPLSIKVPCYNEEESDLLQVGGVYTLTIEFIKEIDTKDLTRGVRIKITHLGYRKTVKKLARHAAKSYSFDTLEYGRVTVEDYFKRKYNIKLRRPDLQLVDVGGQKTNYLPAEVCKILPDQPFHRKLTDRHTAAMIAVACQPPNVNGEAIVNQGLTHLGFKTAGPELQSFGVSVGSEMAVVPGRILPKPGVRYSTTPASIDDKASWNLKGVKFAVGARLEKWTILVIKDGTRDEFAGPYDPDLRQVISGFRNMCNVSGMQVTADPSYATAQLPPNNLSDPMRRAAINTIRITLLSAKPKPILLLVVLSSGDKVIYDGLKHLCDAFLDVATVCVQSSKIRKSNPQYLANMALKVNMKLGGINHELDPASSEWLNMAPTMMVGMDITHPSPGSVVGTPSVAAVVASIDNKFAQYPASLEIQTSDQEMIENLKNMMIDRLKLFQTKNNGKLPDRVVVYRVGVSEGQFKFVRMVELPLIVESFEAFGTPKAQYKPKLAIMICDKRHRTRFFPTEESSAAGDGNPRPGTVVDRGVTAIYDFDFFLQAHGGLQGTTRPTHYYVVHDDIGFTADEIQGLTNSLSYMFSRTTKAVSLVSPTYYADVACERGRCYLRRLFYGFAGDGTTSASGIAAVKDVINEAKKLWNGGVSKPCLKDTMFYL